MTTTIELKINSHDGKKVLCVCERRWCPVAGYFWNVREKDSGEWRGFMETDEIADLIVKQLKVREINNG